MQPMASLLSCSQLRKMPMRSIGVAMSDVAHLPQKSLETAAPTFIAFFRQSDSARHGSGRDCCSPVQLRHVHLSRSGISPIRASQRSHASPETVVSAPPIGGYDCCGERALCEAQHAHAQLELQGRRPLENPAVSLAKVVAKALVWTSLESFALSGLSLISLVVFARFLTAEQFGVAAIALAIVQGLTVPVELLFHDALIQRKDLEEIHVNSAFTMSAVLGTSLCGCCWLFADMVERAMGEPHLGQVLKWMSLSLIGMGFGSVVVAMQRRKLEFRALALRSLLGRAGSAVVAISLAFFGAGVWSLVAQQVLLVCLGTLTLWAMTADRPHFGFSWLKARELLAFGWFSTLHNVLFMAVPRVFMVLLGGYLGSASVGMLSLAFRGLDMLRDLLAGALNQVAMPMFSRIREDRNALFDAYGRSVQLTALVTYPIFVGLSVCSSEVVTIVFGKQWQAAAPYFVIVALMTLPFFLRLYSPAMLTAIGKPSAPVWQSAAELAYVFAGMLLVGRGSVTLAMTVWASRLLVSIPVDLWMLKRWFGMDYNRQLRGVYVPALAAGGMGCMVLLVKHFLLQSLSPQLRIVPIGLVGLASYVSILLLLDRELVKQFLSFVGQSLQARRSRS
jgi:O-antigen/teichoic acid export membrane protein